MPAISQKELICFANSRKPAGSCVAGKEFEDGVPGAWIRPVSRRPSGELSESERSFSDGKDPQIGDIVSVPILSKQRHAFQTENYIIDDSKYWRLIRKATWAEIQSCVDDVPGQIWANESSSFNGRHDKVSEPAAAALGESLKLIGVRDLRIFVQAEGADVEKMKRRVRGDFTLNHLDYRLSITDPVFENRYLARQDGEYPIGAAILCVSLGEPFQNFAYKLIAGVISHE